ncbi:4-hydroxy-3-methylbut-2-enyl diphosphate reductase [Verrucomicrobiales bacterium]|nr:4-hydroxy-3-methylbut-2-enyl diphosphate reductase [Verrucomicrobiales bacterium]MDB4721752.1 4-hydroxy-3-methylbut-2-enyl diphosphate reductase [Verrucomicrobiales bacterium]|tara:strand:- start:2501 stop:3424 length:924 start_codon:yes stop_codon:yes gene_type:complete
MQIEKEIMSRVNVHLASHYGMCFGVRDALAATRSTYDENDVTVLGQLVHNPVVSQELTENGVKEGNLNNPITDNEGTVIITAHGASESDRSRWASPHRKVVDTTCPLVHKVHESLASLIDSGFFPVVIGKKGHAEVNGIIGDFPQAIVIEKEEDIFDVPYEGKIGIVSQTTQPTDRVNELVERIRSLRNNSEVRFIDTVCSPTKNRQKAVKDLCQVCDLIVVVGGSNSNNTSQLVSTVEGLGSRAVQVERPEDLILDWFIGVKDVGVTAGTSTLNETVISVSERIKAISEELAVKDRGYLGKERILC